MNPRSKFNEELTELLNRHNTENLFDMPDFLLANMIEAFMVNCGRYVKQTLDWHGCDSVCHSKPDQNKGEKLEKPNGGSDD